MSLRREFLKTAVLGSAASIFSPTISVAEVFSEIDLKKEETGYTFLFQGDSITDGNRTRNSDWNHVMGHGFAYLIASRLWFDHPEKKFQFFNRGVSGNKITDLAQRWQMDTIDLKPDLINILVGVNDTEAAVKGSKENTTDQFESDYRKLLQTTKEKLPNVQLVLCIPFLFPVGRVKDKPEVYEKELRPRQEIVRKLAKEFNAIEIDFQSEFDKALKKAAADYWIWDGIHPMPAGHELMARFWLNEVQKKIKFVK
ncbi:SGNH/GDSL hydrolase family protein [Dyadobacter sp. CY345]|uniref:SGNH/GDSL hydrolase family protein n=1 Tax=Dyadobacter sp. CY345 TaxID=2909335 RepID=UPI001F43D859|nr:SGNH/GDSL hydrolase family protein [Dyadobacter sp. CY345]MCF2443161.1 SGNH/GDSL hydrolase family protein [Dyadobacter sp. CY345]